MIKQRSDKQPQDQKKTKMGAEHYLHVYLGRVRKKLGKQGELLETIQGVGYRMMVHNKLYQP